MDTEKFKTVVLRHSKSVQDEDCSEVITSETLYIVNLETGTYTEVCQDKGR